MKDRYNLNLLPIEDELDDTSNPNIIPGGVSSGVIGSATGETTTQLPGMGIDEEMMKQIKQGMSAACRLSLSTISRGLRSLKYLKIFSSFQKF